MKPVISSGAEARVRFRRTALTGGIVILGLVLSACGKPDRARTFTEFMDDSIAREGVLARCDLDREAASDDIECANARRAAIALALRDERERLERLELESERKLERLRQQVANAERAAAESAAAAAAAAAAAEEQAYERLWREQGRGAADEEHMTPESSSAAAESPTEWPGFTDPLPFSPLNRIDPPSTDSELAEASLDSNVTPPPAN